MNELWAVINTLNEIEVHGEANLDRLLACIRMLKEFIRKQEEVNNG